jgi:hypothetical protein
LVCAIIHCLKFISGIVDDISCIDDIGCIDDLGCMDDTGCMDDLGRIDNIGCMDDINGTSWCKGYSGDIVVILLFFYHIYSFGVRLFY